MTASTRDESPVPRRWLILVVLCLSLFLVVVDNTIVNVALPTLSRELHATTSGLQWIVDAYSLVFAALLLAAGSLGDRLGRRGVLQAGLAIFGVMSIAAAFAPDTGSLIAVRATMGIGAALVFPATLAILTNVFTDPVERAKAIGIWAAVSGLAVALGPLSGGFLLEHFWWGSVFLVNVPIVALALVLGQRLVPTSRDPHAGRFDAAGVVLSIAAMSLLVWTVIEAPRSGWSANRTVGGFVVAAVLLVAFVTWELHRTDPMLDVRIFTNLRFSAASIAVAVAFFSLFGFIFLITQYFQLVRGYSTLRAGLHTLPFAFAAGIAAPIAPFLVFRVGTKVVVAAGLASMTLGFVVAATLGTNTAYFGPVVGSMVLIAGGLTLTTAPATESIMGSLARAKSGVGSAVNDTTRELGGALGVAVVGSVFASVYGPKLIDALRRFPIPPSALAAAKQSVVAALVVAARAPTAAKPVVLDAARHAFLHGMSAGSLVAAGSTLAGLVFTLAFLPARVHARDADPGASSTAPVPVPVAVATD